MLAYLSLNYAQKKNYFHRKSSWTHDLPVDCHINNHQCGLALFCCDNQPTFTVELQSRSGGWWIALNQSAMAITNATITNLSPYTRYGVRVVAVFGEGERVRSEVRTVVTDEDKPAGPPTIVESSAINTTTLLVRWEVS